MRAVLFDIDGTLLHSAAVDEALYCEAVRAVLGDVQLRPSLHEYEFVTDTGVLRQILDDNSIAGNERTLGEIRSVFVDLLRSHVREHGPFTEVPGASEMLRALQASPDCAVAMATGGWRQSAVFKLVSAGMHFEDIPLATSNDHHERTTIMEIALARLGSSFESVTYYGDGPWDRDACVRLGWKFVAVGPELGGLETYHGVDPCS
jgi:FMN phosphatase YigB (HAD superfamily)